MNRTIRGALAFALTIAFLSACVGSPAPAPDSGPNAAPGTAPRNQTVNPSPGGSSVLPGGSSYQLTDQLPLAPELTKGVLSNGLTYYVRQNGNPGGRVIMYLVVAAGSSVEEDSELGYAHFIEHMAFNGTASFPENALVGYLRSIGMEFGAEVNAYTAREETVYSLEMPTDDPEYFETGLKVLREWATTITFDQAEVDKERGVILEERRLGLGPDETAREAELPVLLAGSRHGERDPIGTEDSIRAASAATLRAFYEKHYRPEIMAVIIVGDVDPAATVEAVTTEFSFPSRDGTTKPRILFPVEPTSEMSFVTTFHEDFDNSVIFYEKLVPYGPETTIEDYYGFVKRNLAVIAIGTRLDDLTLRGQASWQEAWFDDDYFYGGTRLYAFTLQTADGGELTAFSDLAREVERIRRHGFTDSEFKRVIDNHRRWLSTLNVEDDDLKSYSFADEYVRNFMYGEPVPGVTNERVYIKAVLDSVTVADLNAVAAGILAADEGFVAVRARAGDWNASLTEAAFEAALEGARAASIDPLPPGTDQGGLYDAVPQPGTIVTENKLNNGITELVLSNGARVLLKPTTYDRDAIRFAAYSPGGYTSLPAADHDAASLASTLMDSAGLAAMDAVRLEELTAGLDAGVSWSIAENGEIMSGKTATGDLAAFLRLVYLYAAEQGRDARTFGRTRDLLADQVVPYVQDPEYRFGTEWALHLFGGNPRAAALDAERIRGLDFEDTRRMVHDAFADASEFTYVLVGDFKLEEAKRLVLETIGAIPAGTPDEPAVIEPMKTRADGPARVEYPLARERRASVRMIWAAESPWTWEREARLEFLSMALNNRLLDALREDLGGTYVVSCSSVYTSLPVEQYAVVVSFETDPDRVDELIAEVRAEIAALTGGNFQQVYVDQIKAMVQRDYDGRNRTNEYWVSGLTNAIVNGLDFDILGRAKAGIEFIDLAGFTELATEIFTDAHAFVYVMTPEE